MRGKWILRKDFPRNCTLQPSILIVYDRIESDGQPMRKTNNGKYHEWFIEKHFTPETPLLRVLYKVGKDEN